MKKINNRDGSKTLIGRDGTKYLVPAGIIIVRNIESGFKSRVQGIVEDEMDKGYSDISLTMSAIGSERAGNYKVLYNKKGSQLHLMITTLKNVPMGWAIYNRREGRVEESMAAIDQKYRGLGIYPLLIRMIKTEINQVVLSDQSLTVANAIQWLKTGTYSQEHKRIRANPAPRLLIQRRPTRQAIQRAVQALLIREATR